MVVFKKRRGGASPLRADERTAFAIALRDDALFELDQQRDEMRGCAAFGLRGALDMRQ
jgi:hypothetical protein